MFGMHEGNVYGSATLLRYLIARHEGTRLEVLTLGARPGSETLPVFTGDREAREFLRLGGVGGDWHVRESTTGELVSILMGDLRHVDLVVLDPAFGVSANDAEPLSTSRNEFVAVLMGERPVAH